MASSSSHSSSAKGSYKHKKRHHTQCVDELQQSRHEPELPFLQRHASKILHSMWFDYFMGGIIIFNMIAMIVEVDRTAIEDEASTDFHWTVPCGWVILVIFVLELAVRLFVFRNAFWADAWNIFDFMVVVVDAFFSALGLVAENLFPVSVLRILRLAKLARVSKVLRVFPELRVLVAGLVSSMSAIFWGTVLLLLSLLVWAMIAVLFIQPLNTTLDYGGSCERCPRAYSSVFQAALTFWQQIVTGDSWGQATVPLIEKYPATALFFMPMFLSIGLAVMNLILGVIVSVAQQAKEELEEEDCREELVLKQEQHTHLLGMCIEMDENSDGTITLEELLEHFDKPGAFRDAMMDVHVTQEEIEIVWKLIDTDQEGAVPYEDVISAIYKMKGSDTHFMLAYIKHYITLVRDSIKKQAEAQHLEELSIQHQVEGDLRKIEQVEALQMGAWQELAGNNFQRSGLDVNEAGEDKGIVPVTNLCNQLQHVSVQCGSTDAGCRVKLSVTEDEIGTWLKQVCRRIGSLQVELQDIWRNMEGKIEVAVAPVPDTNKGIVTMTQDLDKVSSI